MTRYAALSRSLALDRLIDTVCGTEGIEDEDIPEGASASRRKAGRPSKLGAADRAAVRASREPISVLMELFNVSRSTITRARRVKTPAPTSEL